MAGTVAAPGQAEETAGVIQPEVDFSFCRGYDVSYEDRLGRAETRANLLNHGMDFVDLDEAFFKTSVVRAAKLGRLIAIGRLADGVITVIFVLLGTEAISVVSMRSASRKERNVIHD